MARSLAALSAPAFTSLNSLANAGLACSAAVSVGTTANVVDHLVELTINSPATFTASLSTVINLFAYGSIDGTIWSGSGTTNELVTGADKTLLWSANGNQAVYVGTIILTTTTAGTSIVFKSQPLSIAAAFGGTLPNKYVIVAQNASGAALPATGHSIAVSELAYS